jgi:hypothetical protein
MAVGPNDEVVAVGYMDQFGVTDGAATLYTAPVSNANWTIKCQTGVFNGTAGEVYNLMLVLQQASQHSPTL